MNGNERARPYWVARNRASTPSTIGTTRRAAGTVESPGDWVRARWPPGPGECRALGGLERPEALLPGDRIQGLVARGAPGGRFHAASVRQEPPRPPRGRSPSQRRVRKLTEPLAATITWSSTAIPTSSPTSIKRRVMLTSSSLGSGSPLG